MYTVHTNPMEWSYDVATGMYYWSQTPQQHGLTVLLTVAPNDPASFNGPAYRTEIMVADGEYVIYHGVYHDTLITNMRTLVNLMRWAIDCAALAVKGYNVALLMVAVEPDEQQYMEELINNLQGTHNALHNQN